MTTTTLAIRDRVWALDWAALRAALDSVGHAVTEPLLDEAECADLAGWNALHQDLYGDVFFPFQVLTVLSEPGVDFDGGEFVLLEQRPRAQSRAHVLRPPRGAFVIFPTHHRPNAGRNGHHRVGLRHGVSTVTRGQRTALGIIFHDAR